MKTSTHDTKLIDDVKAFVTAEKARNPDYSFADFAKACRVAHAALSSWLGGKYGANPANIEAKFRDLLAGRAVSARLPAAKTIDNSVIEEITQHLDTMRATDCFGVITGNAGIGKTEALRKYAGTHPRTVMIALTQESSSTAGLRRAVWNALGAPSVARGSSMFDACVALVKGTENLFILDDAHLLTNSGFSWLVGFFDATGCGIALVGNPEIIRTSQHLPQWSTRIAAIENVDFPDVEKCSELTALARHLLRHWLQGFPEAIKSLDMALPEILNKTRNVRDGVQILRTVRLLLLNGVEAPAAIATAVASKRLKHKFKNVDALLATPALLELTEGKQ